MIPPTHTLTVVGLFEHEKEGRSSVVTQEEIELVDDGSTGYLEHNAEVIMGICDDFIARLREIDHECLSLSHTILPIKKQ